MRTLDATLQAGMANQSGTPIFRARFHNGFHQAVDTSSTTTVTPYKYKIKNLEMQVTLSMKDFVDSGIGTIVAIRIERGRRINGVDYWVNSAWYAYQTIEKTRRFITFNCHVFYPQINVKVLGDAVVEAVLLSAIDQNNYYAGLPQQQTFDLPAITEWWHGIQFLADGKWLLSNSQKNLPSIMMQKYLAYMYVEDDNVIRAISKNYNFENETAIEISNSKILEISIKPHSTLRRYIWKDEPNKEQKSV